MKHRPYDELERIVRIELDELMTLDNPNDRRAVIATMSHAVHLASQVEGPGVARFTHHNGRAH